MCGDEAEMAALVALELNTDREFKSLIEGSCERWRDELSLDLFAYAADHRQSTAGSLILNRVKFRFGEMIQIRLWNAIAAIFDLTNLAVVYSFKYRSR